MLNQGLRNASDAISMIQTAEGALSVIDEKLIRMKELAEQAARPVLTPPLQREIMNSEYQAMAAEIDRIANATDFNGIKLIDGSVQSGLHQGQRPSRSTSVPVTTRRKTTISSTWVTPGPLSETGLQVGGDAKNDIWGHLAGTVTGVRQPGRGAVGLLRRWYTSDPNDGTSGSVRHRLPETCCPYGYNYNLTTKSTDGQSLQPLTLQSYIGRHVQRVNSRRTV